MESWSSQGPEQGSFPSMPIRFVPSRVTVWDSTHVLSGQQDQKFGPPKRCSQPMRQAAWQVSLGMAGMGQVSQKLGPWMERSSPHLWDRLRTWGPHDEGGDTVPTAEGSGDEGALHRVRKDSAVQMEEGCLSDERETPSLMESRCPIRWKNGISCLIEKWGALSDRGMEFSV